MVELIKNIDSNGRSIGPNRVWMKTVDLPGLAMSRSIGDVVASRVGVIAIPDVFELTLQESHKMVIIASDGIWGVLSNERVVNIAGNYYNKCDPEAACEMLILEATKAWHNTGEMVDDITVVVIFLN